MSSIEEIVGRLDTRPNHSVVSYREVGIPVFFINAQLTLQEDAKIGPIHEFLLRCIRAGVSSPESISEFLALPLAVVNKQLGAFLYERVVSREKGGSETYQLTKKGHLELIDAVKTKVIHEQAPIYVDGLTRRVSEVDRRSLYNAHQLEDLGIAMVPAMPRRAPKGSDIKVAEVNRVFQVVAGSSRPTRKALKLDAIVGRTNLYFQRATCIAFKSDTTGKISVGFAIDGRLSEDHEISFARSKSAAKSKLFGTLLDSNKRRREVQRVARHVRESLPTVHDALDKQSKAEGRRVLRLKKSPKPIDLLEKPTIVRALHVYEHAPLLARALKESKERLLIISPWIRADVVNSTFVDLLTGCIDRGVSVKIAFGLGRVDRGERDKDAAARSALEGLARTFKNFELIRKGNTHAKVLLVDDEFCVTTSFNWLSFRGDPNQPFREEWGTYIEGPSIVNKYFIDITNDLDG